MKRYSLKISRTQYDTRLVCKNSLCTLKYPFIEVVIGLWELFFFKVTSPLFFLAESFIVSFWIFKKDPLGVQSHVPIALLISSTFFVFSMPLHWDPKFSNRTKKLNYKPEVSFRGVQKDPLGIIICIMHIYIVILNI